MATKRTRHIHTTQKNNLKAIHIHVFKSFLNQSNIGFFDKPFGGIKMNKIKTGLVTLCTAALLFSATPSSARLISIEPTVWHTYPSYEQKAERIINYLKLLEKVDNEFKGSLDLPPDIIWGVPGVRYGVHYATFHYEYTDEILVIDVHQAGGKSVNSPTEFYMHDDAEYGSVDKVFDDRKIKYTFEKVELTPEEKYIFDDLYKRLVDKFCSENETRMTELENLEKAMDILRSK